MLSLRARRPTRALPVGLRRGRVGGVAMPVLEHLVDARGDGAAGRGRAGCVRVAWRPTVRTVAVPAATAPAAARSATATPGRSPDQPEDQSEEEDHEEEPEEREEPE